MMASFGISRTLLFYIFLSLLCLNSEAAVVHLNTSCDPNTNTDTRNSTYQRNLNSLLSSLQSNSSRESGFYNLTVGQDPPDIVYGLFVCRGDVTKETCQECVDRAAAEIVQACPNKKTAIGFYDECTLRYSDRSILSILQTEPKLKLLDTGTVLLPDPVRFMELFVSTMNEIATRAAYGQSGKKYATEEANFTNSQTLYTLAQCTPDLSVSDCRFCLQTAIVSFPSRLVKEGGRIVSPSCILRYEFNPFYRITAPPQSKEEKNHNKSIWIGASLSAPLGLALFSTCVFFFIWRRRNIKEDKGDSQEVQLLDLVGGRVPNENSSENFNLENVGRSQDFPSVQLDILDAATNHFCDDNKLGEGGFGPVYKGTLPNGKEIAVKRLSRTSGQGLLEFKNEIMLIARLQHKNLVRLLGCCLEKNEKLLVYEFMPNRSLDVFLFDSRLAVQLPWQKRFSIVKGIARGIMYLHEDSRLRIIHRDLKASNVLLDHEMNPKISDFGMARIFGGDQNEANTNRVVGTYGYMAPEYAMEGLFSIKSDVFSFGVLLLEIISGKRNNGFHLLECGESLLTFGWKLWSKREGMVLIDEHLVESCLADEVLKCIQIGLLCGQEDPTDRPTMSTVVVMLANDNTTTLPLPTKPAFSVGRFVAARPIQPTSNDRICSVNEVTISNLLPR